jgi:hypothetical protein
MALLHLSRPQRRSPEKQAIIEWIAADDNRKNVAPGAP